MSDIRQSVVGSFLELRRASEALYIPGSEKLLLLENRNTLAHLRLTVTFGTSSYDCQYLGIK